MIITLTMSIWMKLSLTDRQFVAHYDVATLVRPNQTVWVRCARGGVSVHDNRAWQPDCCNFRPDVFLYTSYRARTFPSPNSNDYDVVTSKVLFFVSQHESPRLVSFLPFLLILTLYISAIVFLKFNNIPGKITGPLQYLLILEIE